MLYDTVAYGDDGFNEVAGKEIFGEVVCLLNRLFEVEGGDTLGIGVEVASKVINGLGKVLGLAVDLFGNADKLLILERLAQKHGGFHFDGVEADDVQGLAPLVRDVAQHLAHGRQL